MPPIKDPITGVIKFKKNKNKEPKEISLSINHTNLQQLIQILQQHSQQTAKPCTHHNDASKKVELQHMPNLEQAMCTCNKQSADKICSYCSNHLFAKEDNNKQALNIIMQLIQNQMKDQDGTDCQQCTKPNIDPDLLQQFFSIDREEECSESSDDDDEEDDYDNEEEECEDEEEEDEEEDELDMDEEMMQKVKSFDLSNPGIMSSISGDPTKVGGVYFGNNKKEMRKRI